MSRCLLSSTNYPCTLLQVKAPKGKPHAPHVVQDVRNKKDGFLKYKKVFYASARFIHSLFCCLWSCLWLCATRFARSGPFPRFVQLPPLLPLGLPLCVLHALHVLQIPRDRLWTWIQDDETTESSGEEESSDEEEEAAEEEEEQEDEEGSDAGSAIKEEEDEPSVAQRAPRSTHLEVARMAAQAQPKGTPVKAKPEPEELSKKRKEKPKSPPKKKSKGKQKVEEKPKHVHYAVEGEPHRKMPPGATRGEKYQAGAAYDNDVQVMQRTLKSEHDVSLGRACQHYKACLAEETQARRELGLVLLLVTDVRAYSVQMVL